MITLEYPCLKNSLYNRLSVTCLGMQGEKGCLYGAERSKEKRRNEDTLQIVERRHREDR